MNIKDYITEILTTLILLLSIVFLFLKVYYYPIQDYQKNINKLSNYYKKVYEEKNAELKKREIESKKYNAVQEKIPSILKAINNTCKKKVVILKLSPIERNPPKFEIKVIAKYFDFLTILSEFEKLNIMVESIAIDEYEGILDNPKKAITLIVEVVGDVRKTTNEVKGILEKAISQYSRNPFETKELDGKGIVEQATNLTKIYKLTGITLIKDSPFATINNKDYFIGESFFDKGEITKIKKGRVEIAKRENGIEKKYFIEFRNKNNKE